MILHYPDDTDQVLDLVNRIKRLGLSFTKVENPDLTEISLEVDDDLYEGYHEVHEYLDMVRDDIQEWECQP